MCFQCDCVHCKESKIPFYSGDINPGLFANKLVFTWKLELFSDGIEPFSKLLRDPHSLAS